MSFDPILPEAWIALLALVALGLTLVFYGRSGKRLGWRRSALLMAFRLAGLAGVLVLLLQPSREEKVPQPAVDKTVWFAVDTSQSMREAHADGSSRIDAARADLEKAGVLDGDTRYRFFTIGDTAAAATPESIALAAADGATTRIDTSTGALLRMAGAGGSAMFLLSDGHDHEMVPPGETARRLRSRGLPLFAVPYGTGDSARDVSIRLAGYHPQAFVRQSTPLEVMVRATGCPHETVQVELLLDGQVVQKKTLETGIEPYHTLSFTVSHEEPGQYEYGFRVTPVANEKELSNNTATTYLNVISGRIRVLEIEGKPFWDSTFLRRSFARNDKFDIDSLVAFTADRARPIRSNPDDKKTDLKPPASVEDLMPYQIVVLGREAERVIGVDGLKAIAAWVRDRGGIVIFSRGKAWQGEVKELAEMEPIDWETDAARGVKLEVTPQAQSLAAFRLLREVSAQDAFPEVISYPAHGAPKTLAATFSVAADQSPAVVYRRFGSGQTMSLGVGNLWRWVFNPNAEYENNAYDRFWDQLALWLLSNSGVSPVEGYSLRADSANVPVGESLRLRLIARGRELPAAPPALETTRDGAPVVNLAMNPMEAKDALAAEFTPKETGRYTATLALPGQEKPLVARFMVYRDQLETIETALDRGYLEQLAKASGGRMIDATEIGAICADLLRGSGEQPPLARRVPLWDKAWVCWAICLLLAGDWFLRRRWGLT